MTSLTLKKAAGIAFGALLMTLAAPAQQSQVTTRFNVPFSFIAGNEVLPAGTYNVWLNSGAVFVDLQYTGDNHIHRLMLTPEMVSRTQSGNEPALLRFEKFGDRHVLSAVWNRERSEGYEVKRGKAARELERENAMTAAPGMPSR